MDTLVIDIETKNTFQDVGGRENLEKLEISIVGVYSYKEDKYFAFEEKDFPELGKILQKTQLIVTFAGKRFDIPVMEKYFNFKVKDIKHYDILEEIEKKLGRRIGLGILAEANVGLKKTGIGMDAIDLYAKGEMQKLKEYCLNDVKLTKELYDLIKRQKFLFIPQRDSNEMLKIEILPAEETSQNQLI
jgi:DEAD/DEAH box helicase domain-containing protein